MIAWLIETTLKGSILIAVVAVIHLLVGRRVDPRFRHLLWVIVLLRLLMPVVPTSPVSMFPAPVPAVRQFHVAVAPADIEGPVPTRLYRVEQGGSYVQYALWIWLAGAALMLARTLITAFRMHRRVRGLRGVVETDLVLTPALYGIFRPVLLLPRGLTEAEKRHVVLHETWHLKRMDVAVSWLLAAAQIVHWFNPLVWFAASRIREEREISCDELALSLLQEEERPDYGRTILKLLGRFAPAAPVPALVGMVNGKQKMKRRIQMIASFRNRTRFTMLFLALVAVVGVAGLTNAEDVKHFRFMHKLDPATQATIRTLDEKLTFELNNASFGDLLATVSSKAGVSITQSPEIASLDVQDARFTLKAENVPAHAVLMEALVPFKLSVEPTETGVTIINRPSGERFLVDIPNEGQRKIIVRHSDSENLDEIVKELEREHPGGISEDQKVQERVFVKMLDRGAPKAFDENGRLHSELNLSLDINGEKSTGKLTLDIQK